MRLTNVAVSADVATNAGEHSFHPLLLSRRENEDAVDLLEELDDLEGVTTELQRLTLTLSGVRRLFDTVLETFPSMRSRIGENASIVNYPELENGMIKLQRNGHLTAAERSTCVAFRSDAEARAVEDKPKTLVGSALKKRKVARRDAYVDVSFAPPTSNECERFFSKAKYVLTDHRKSMDPETLEALKMLAYNRSMWSVFTIDAI